MTSDFHAPQAVRGMQQEKEWSCRTSIEPWVAKRLLKYPHPLTSFFFVLLLLLLLLLLTMTLIDVNDPNNVLSINLLSYFPCHGRQLRMENHQHYVQGVAWDPLGHYVCSQSNDRTCKVRLSWGHSFSG
eukprot:1161640-Pelagomonas_calceolata.AAC.9